jgi:hypothetical protein
MSFPDDSIPTNIDTQEAHQSVTNNDVSTVRSDNMSFPDDSIPTFAFDDMADEDLSIVSLRPVIVADDTEDNFELIDLEVASSTTISDVLRDTFAEHSTMYLYLYMQEAKNHKGKSVLIASSLLSNKTLVDLVDDEDTGIHFALLDLLIHSTSKHRVKMMQWLQAIGCSWNARTFRAAVQSEKSIDTLIWLKNEGCPWDERVFEAAITLKDSSISFWLRFKGCPWDSRTFTAAVDGMVDMWILQWLYNEQCPWNKDTFIAAVKRGDMDILKWLHEKQCPWDAECIHVAIEEKNGKVLQWLHQQGCPWNETTRDRLIQNFASHN